MARHDFSIATKRQLALRAAHFCSNPRCWKLTTGPASDPDRALLTGHAAHIRAASKKGPRYDETQSEAERRSAANGIWLCRECGDIVDKDWVGHPADMLLAWKKEHEAMIAEIRQQGWSQSIALLHAGRVEPDLARDVIALFEDRRAFWEAFDMEFPDRVRRSLDTLRGELTRLRTQARSGGPLETVILALSQTIRHFFVSMEHLDLTTLRCDSGDPDWLQFEGALLALRKSVGIQVSALAKAFGLPLQGEFAAYVQTQG
jgi:ribosomal protein L37AE/L43A